MTPFDRVTLALDAAGFGGARPKCPSCPPKKRRGFSVKEARKDGFPTVLVHCHRGCTVEEIVSALGLDPAQLFSGNGQAELFDGRRFSPVALEGVLALPPSSSRHFWAASCIGSYRHADGSARPVRGSGQIVTVTLNRRQRRAALAACEISPRRWRELVGEWAERRMAHRCDADQTTLFRQPEPACPMCGSLDLTMPHIPESKSTLKALVPSQTLPLHNSQERRTGRNPAAFEHGTALTPNRKESRRFAEGIPPLLSVGEARRVRRVSRCRECAGEAGHEPDCRSRPPLTGVRRKEEW